MEHDAFVPFPVPVVRRALAEPARVLRCLSAAQQDASAPAGTLTGRLRLRIGGSSITYRGSLRIGECDGGFEIEGEGVEARGTGTVKVALVIGLDPEDGGTRLGFSGAVQADGRLTEYDQEAVDAAGRRLLDRFLADLVLDLEAEPPGAGAQSGADAPGAAGAARATGPGAGPANGADPVEGVNGVNGVDPVGADDASDDLDAGDPDGDDLDSLADAAGRPGSPRDGVPEEPAEAGFQVPDSLAGLDGVSGPGAAGSPPAEAAHARRTMIGRSAEEVDHAPPRGRYAPVPAPPNGSTGDTLRWAVPAAAALLAAALVAGRALRRRR